MEFLDKLRKKPEKERRIILWSIVIAIGLILTILWLYNSYKAVNKLKQEDISQGINTSNLKIPDLPEEILETTTQ